MKPFTHVSRRRLLLSASAGLLLSTTASRRVIAANESQIIMSGAPNGSHVWFRPRGLLIAPGQAVRWVNHDLGNVHTTTAYHPDNGKPLRIPPGASAWNSGYLMPDESFLMVFDIPGIYDYFCIPHEQAGMVGRIVVGKAIPSVRPYADSDAVLPSAAVTGFPDATKIMEDTRVE